MESTRRQESMCALELAEKLKNGEFGDFIMDSKYRGVISHSDYSALAFLGPLLIECGYFVSRDMLVHTIARGTLQLHPAEIDYFQQCLD